MIYLNNNVEIPKNLKMQNGNAQFPQYIKLANIKNDSVHFSGKETNNDKPATNKILAAVVAGLALVGGAFLLIKKGKVSGDAGKGLKDGAEKITKGGSSSYSGRSNRSSYSTTGSPKTVPGRPAAATDDYDGNSSFFKTCEDAKQYAKELEAKAKIAEAESIRTNEELKKTMDKQDRLHAKIDDELKKNDELLKQQKELLNKMEENFKKFHDDFKKTWEEYEAKMEKLWEEFHAKYCSNDISSDLLGKLKGKAQTGLDIFKTYGKDSAGKPFEEISALDSVDGITIEKLKQAHRKLFKTYGPKINIGTKAEKIEATKIMQMINPANDDLRTYVELKQK